jgi:hypothetical protein
MIYQLTAKAILDRLKADTGDGGIYEGGDWTLVEGAWNNLANPGNGTRPYIVYSFSGDSEDSQTSDEDLLTLTFQVYDNATNGTDTITAVLDRLHGNGILQTGRIPTYGFHRHVLALDTNTYNAVATECIQTSFEVGPLNEHVCLGTIAFTFRISAQAVSP